MTFLLVLLGIAGFISFIWFLVMLMSWSMDKPKCDCSYITFERFKTLYYMNPKAWVLDDWIVQYSYSVTRKTGWTDKKYHLFYFSFIDALRYKYFRVQNKHTVPEEVLKHFQRDIQAYQDKYTEELKKKAKEIEDLRNCLSPDDEWKEKIKNITASISEDIQASTNKKE